MNQVAMKCSMCGAPFAPNSATCNYCGTMVSTILQRALRGSSSAPSEEGAAVVRDSLEAAKKGLPTDEYWVDGVAEAELYSVREYEFLSDLPLADWLARLTKRRHDDALRMYKEALGISSLADAEALQMCEAIQKEAAHRGAPNLRTLHYGTFLNNLKVAGFEANEATAIATYAPRKAAQIYHDLKQSPSKPDVPGSVFKVRVESSTKNGQPITKNWAFATTGEVPTIISLFDETDLERDTQARELIKASALGAMRLSTSGASGCLVYFLAFLAGLTALWLA